MTLSQGTRLGPYLILGSLGAGGMGEVYRARDTRLDRTVAIKVLSSKLSGSPELRKRFEREARAISSLNHPHICTLYDVGHQDGVDYLVMEHLEGETLAQRLRKGALPTEQALKTAIEITDALDRAHRAGVVHRDLKPGNIMLTRSGAKLLDFGLAKRHGALESRHEGAAESMATTASLQLTQEGKVMGTLQYMAPEQVEGKEADARTDLFAFGAVLYEMLTGQRAFKGNTEASLAGAILHTDPRPVSASLPVSPPVLDRLVRRCLAKDPDDRWQSARDIMLELKWVAEGHDGVAGVAAGSRMGTRTKGWRLVIGVALGVTGAIAVTALVTQRPNRPRSEAAPVVFSVPAARISQWSLGFSLSPDGRTLAYGDLDAAGWRIYLRPLGSQVASVLEGTEHGVEPFWSPDSAYLGFKEENLLKKIKASGGRAETICDARGLGGTWNREGIILFPQERNGPLYRVPAAGGQPTRVTTLDATRHEIAHRWPFFLPDGRHFLYTVAPPHDGEWDCYVGSLDAPDGKLLLSSSGAVIYAAPGYVIFRRNRSLMAQRFDARRLQLEGKPTPIPGVVTGAYHGSGEPTASASDDGVLAWLNSPPPNTELVWLDRRGVRIGTVDAPPGRYEDLAVAPDNRRLAVTRMDATGNRDIWVLDPTLRASRLTFDPDIDGQPIWSRDGGSIYFQSWRTGVGAIYRKPANGSQPEELVYKPTELRASPISESPDGRFLGCYIASRATGGGFWLLPLSGPTVPVPYLKVHTNGGFDISPDGHWATYHANESGTDEIYVQSFPTPGSKFQISTEGGAGPVWVNGGREIQYFVEDKVMAIDVLTTPVFRAGKPHVLWSGPKEWAIWSTPDGQRFVATVPIGDTPASTHGIMLNWTAALKR